ncbi:MAG: pknB 5, partial [Verrucomicrobiaceae bacterium]|nr:pknB 5 [Verrucomicrobiaceae bacterium]
MPSEPPNGPVSAAIPTPSWLAELGWADRYELIEVIGRGGMGQVWKGRDLKTQEIVALKVLDPSRVGDDHMLARLEVEAATLKRLLAAGRHRHIVPVLDFATHETNACMVMAFIPGMDLRSWCDAHKLDLRARVAFIEKVARAAGWCHDNGVIHRDLKPSNILVDATTREPVVVDFSIAKSVGQLPITMTGEALGTAPYMSPEQLDPSLGKVTPASDVYGLGATLYELLTHVHPHPGGMAQIMERHRNEVRPARPSALDDKITKDLDSICLKALAHRPAERYATGTELADDLQCFLADQPVAARTLSSLGYLARRARKRPLVSAAIAGCVIFGGGVLVDVWQSKIAREAETLRQGIDLALAGRSWSDEQIARTGKALKELAPLNSRLASSEHDKWVADVIGDLDAALLRPRMAEGDNVWIPTALDWLKTESPREAERLQSAYKGRMAKWAPYAEVKYPFQNLDGLFPRHDVEPEGDGLVPRRSDDPGMDVPVILVKQPMVSPCEVTASLTCSNDQPLEMAMEFNFNQVRTRVTVASTAALSPEKLAQIEGANKKDGLFVLYVEREGRMVRSLMLPDKTLAHRRFSMQVRMEQDHVRCEVERWNFRMEEPFTISKWSEQNRLVLRWPAHMRLHSLAIRNREEKQRNSPLEQGDVLAAQQRWAEARSQFEAHTGDEISGQEASWKAAYAAYQMADVKEALGAWKTMLNQPPSPWRGLALYELWKHYALKTDMAEAAPYLKSLPTAGADGQAFHAYASAADRKVLVALYEKEGARVNVLCPSNPVLEQAVKVFDLLEIPAVMSARQLGMARHLSGLDEAARELWNTGLDEAAKHHASHVMTEQEDAAAADCLEAWTRVDASENERRLGDWIAQWRKAGSPSTDIVVSLEEARAKARAGRYAPAQMQVQALLQSGIPPWRQARARLLEGMLLREQGREDAALISWKRGIGAVAAGREPPSIMNLCDLFALRLLSGASNQASGTELVTSLIHMSCGSTSTEFQAGLATTLLADADFTAALVAFAKDERGRKLLRDYVLVEEPARASLTHAVPLILEHYFLSAPMPPDAAARVRSTVEALTAAVAEGIFDAADCVAFLRAWGGPARSGPMLPNVQPSTRGPLHARLRWLLAERYIAQGQLAAARPL